MTAFIRICKWDGYQHYKNRNPPWIRLHNALLSSEVWVSGSDASRTLAIAIMLLASRSENKIPANAQYLTRVAFLNSPPDLQPLFDCGFIEMIDENGERLQDASKMLQNHVPDQIRPYQTITDQIIPASPPAPPINGSHALDPEKQPTTQATITTGKRATRFKVESLSFEDRAKWFDFCKSERPDLDASKTLDSFSDFWLGKPGQHGLKSDWLATWRNWVRNQKPGPHNASGLQAGAAAYLAQSLKPEKEVGGERIE